MKFWPTALLFFAATLTTRSEESFQIVVDDAWQGAQGYHFSGRLTEIHPAPLENSNPLRTLYRNIRMLFTSGEAGLVTWRVAEKAWTLRVDAHGYWELADHQSLDWKAGWHAIETKPVASSIAGFLVVDPRNPIGLISDIDDTILVSDVLNKSALLKNSLTVSPEKRAAVLGMAEIYQKLVLKNPAPDATAIFYLSSSPRQLTDNLRRFLSVNGFPRGVLQLKKISRESGDSTSDHQDYKLRHLETILAAFPQVRFYFFGDDAESDPEIYAQVQRKYPDQVAGIWIRRLNPDPKRVTYPGQRALSELIP